MKHRFLQGFGSSGILASMVPDVLSSVHRGNAAVASKVARFSYRQARFLLPGTVILKVERSAHSAYREKEGSR